MGGSVSFRHFLVWRGILLGWWLEQTGYSLMLHDSSCFWIKHSFLTEKNEHYIIHHCFGVNIEEGLLNLSHLAAIQCTIESFMQAKTLFRTYGEIYCNHNFFLKFKLNWGFFFNYILFSLHFSALYTSTRHLTDW